MFLKTLSTPSMFDQIALDRRRVPRLGGIAAGAAAFLTAPRFARAQNNRAEGDTMTPLLTMPAVKSIDLPTGVTLQYVEQGDPAGIPVLLLHGYVDSWHSFERVLPDLPASLRVFALTQRGHGDAGRPATGYSLGDFAADVAAFLDALGIESAVVGGHSMGSSIAQRFALDHPARTRGLALIGSVTSWRGNPGLIELWDTAVATLTDPVDPAFVREFQESTVTRPVPPAFLETMIAESLKIPARVWQAALEGILADDWSAELGKIAVPTLIVWGDQDGLALEREQPALAAAIARSRLAVYADTGHAPHWEEPKRIADDLATFIAGLAG
jgi:pimeloyl-ACP methyl ester carboxylesterase